MIEPDDKQINTLNQKNTRPFVASYIAKYTQAVKPRKSTRRLADYDNRMRDHTYIYRQRIRPHRHCH